MPLVTTTEMFKKAYDGGYAVGAFNVNNMEIVQGITEACQEQHAPVVLQVSKGARAYANHTYLVKMVEAAVIECPDIPIALHLDHGPDFETCKACIDGGFSSVMIDCSSRPFDENVEETKKVVEYAHSHGAYKFTPEQCTRNADGVLVPPPLRFDVLEEVSKRLPGFPIVLHGSSSVPREFVDKINKFGGKMPDAIGIPEEELRHAAQLSVCKINIDSDIRLAITASIREHFAEHPDHFDPRQYLKPARQAVKDMVTHKLINVLGCNGKA